MSDLLVFCNNNGLGFWNVNPALKSCVRYGDVPFLRNTLVDLEVLKTLTTNFQVQFCSSLGGGL